jgi:hypothetical protein
MSIESQATFYFRNVCDYTPTIKSESILTESIITGFAEFSNLLRTIYQDWRSYETSTLPSERTKIGIMTDDLENYHNLTDTLDCLFSIATVGQLCSKGEVQYLDVDKLLFKNDYKKTVAFPFEMLEKYGFYFRYFKSANEAADYKRCDRFHFYFANGSSIIEAAKFIANRLNEMEKKKEIPPKVAFMLADYYYILTGTVNQNPTQDSILATLGSLSGLYKELVRAAQDECGFVADSVFNPYVFPNRTITFKQKQKTICKFAISVDNLNVRLPLSFEIAKSLIDKRDSLPLSIRNNIERFGCVNCGKCENRANIVTVEGIPLCNLPYSNFITEDSRCLAFNITDAEEAKIICIILKQNRQRQ